MNHGSVYPQEEFDRMKDCETTHPWYLNLDALVLEGLRALGLSGDLPLRFLDVGFGTGRLFKKISAFFPAWLLSGTDPSRWAISHAQALGLKAETLPGLAEALPYQDSQFDIVTCLDVLYLQSLSDQTAVREIFRVLKPGGIAVINVPALEGLKGGHTRHVLTGTRYDRRRLRNLVEQEGFHILKLSYWNFILLPVLFMIRLLSRGDSSQGTSDLALKIPSLLRFAMNGFYAAERLWMRYFSFPVGSSLFLIAQKPAAARHVS